MRKKQLTPQRRKGVQKTKFLSIILPASQCQRSLQGMLPNSNTVYQHTYIQHNFSAINPLPFYYVDPPLCKWTTCELQPWTDHIWLQWSTPEVLVSPISWHPLSWDLCLRYKLMRYAAFPSQNSPPTLCPLGAHWRSCLFFFFSFWTNCILLWVARLRTQQKLHKHLAYLQ